ncbi:MAG: hypothetical protein HYI21_15375 [Sediminibacterium sp. Gen4]|jgi:hypothetical protein|uniref:hypothetical protein n=1 Tax=unclassified Sediminibacterium TaxID=2635961 RepID=UPI0015B9A0EC|nr:MULTISPECIES: hypothetical protein [unclassified Sediminibacterium]MBW0163801.1 hypothetical protein [Sediminibacterium sp.]NWK67409.1 hypothetical protein [Sediminibacterium sp. Gen4]
MKYCVTFFLLLLSVSLIANDSLLISRLLQRIDYLQAKDNAVFPKGSIPSYRMYALNKTRYKADINPFFTGLVAFTLEDIKRDLSPTQQIQANTIIHNTQAVYPIFQNRKNKRDTYNFWPTEHPQIFPHSGWLNLFNKSRSLPDDLDDTVIILMAQKSHDSIAKAIHQLMQRYTNNENKKVTNTFPEYQKIGAYSTWFGEKMPVDFDISVLSNVLYFVQFYNLKWTAADSASLYLIEDMIKTNKHVQFANYVSPHYATLPNILYHVSRLMSLQPIPSLEKLKPQLIEDTKKALASATTFMDQVILSTSLLRWGVEPPKIIIDETKSLIDLIEDEQFYFFIASMASMLPDPWKKRVTNMGVGTFYYYCPAYNNLLLLENLIWQKRRRK